MIPVVLNKLKDLLGEGTVVNSIQDRRETGADKPAVDRRRFIELCGKYAVALPPAIGLLVSATEAEAHCASGPPTSPHAQPGCSTH